MNGRGNMCGKLVVERLRINPSIEQLAREVWAKPQDIEAWERGTSEPFGPRIATLAQVYGRSAE